MSSSGGADPADVLLCNMPFGLVATPSLALGLLQGSVASRPFRTRQANFLLAFARQLTWSRYELVARRWEAGEWVFAQALFPDRDLDPSGFVERILNEPSLENWTLSAAQGPDEAAMLVEQTAEAALEARRLAAGFLAECLEALLLRRPRVVGFSCTFQQRVASLALARAVKERSPETFVVFGGVECHHVRGLELFRQFPFVDALVSGPGDVAFPEVVDRVLAGRSLEGLAGVLGPADRRGALLVPPADAPGPAHLDELPLPCFDDYFAELAANGLEGAVPIYLSLETSRGCAWAQRPSRHCTFCGLNSTTPRHAHKSSARMVEEIGHFARRYPGPPIVMTDSGLPMSYFDDAIPELAAQKLGATIQYETRVTLAHDQLVALRAAGIVQIQPGIESLSTPVLRLMRKGTTALQNIQLLKWSRELGLTVLWNLLAGLPGEPEEAYRQMAELVPLLTHLSPPQSFRFVTIVRGSPLFEHADELGLSAAEAPEAYRHVFPFERPVLSNLASQFPRDERELERVSRYTSALQEAISAWQRGHAASDLLVVDSGDIALVVDRRPIARKRTIVLEGLSRWLVRACADATSLRALHEGALASGFSGASLAEVEDGLESLRAQGLVVREKSRFLSLALRILEGTAAGRAGIPVVGTRETGVSS